MSNTVPEKTNANEEIDLLKIIYNIWLLIRSILLGAWNLVVWLFAFFLRKWLPVGISIILGVGASFISQSIFEPYYVSDITLRTNVIPNSEMIPYINNLHQYCSDNNVPALSAALGIADMEEGDIVDIEAFWIVDLSNDGVPDYIDEKNRHNPYDTLNVRMNDRFAVRMKVKDPDGFGLVRDGILSYIDQNQSYIERNLVRISHYEETFERIDYDINQLDSLQEVKYFEETRSNIPDKGGQMVFLQEQRTQLLYEDIHKLTAERQIIDREKRLFDGVVTLLIDFTPTSSRYNSTLYYAFRLIPASLILMFMLLLVIEFRREIYKALTGSL